MVKGRILAVSLLLALVWPVRAQHQWEVSLGGEYLLTAYNIHSPHNTCGTGFQAVVFPYVTDSYSYGLKFDFGFAPHSICGNRIGAEFMIRTPVLAWLETDIGLGLSSYSKPSFVTYDAQNVYISTPLVCFFDLGLVARLDQGPSLAFRFLHSSNGNMRRPNRGLNYFRLEMGFPLGKEIYHYSTSRGDSSRSPFFAYHEVGLMGATGLTFSRHSMQSGLFLCYNLSLNYEYHYTPTYAFGATLDLWYNYSHPWQLPRYHDTYTFPMYCSMLAFVERFWGPVSVKGGVGMVLAASSRVMVPYYERLAVYYNFGSNYVGIGINAHGGQAEFIEWSYGRRFPIGKRKE